MIPQLLLNAYKASKGSMTNLFGETWFVFGDKQRIRWKMSWQTFLSIIDVSLVFLGAKYFAGTKAEERNKKAAPALMLIHGHLGRETDA